MAEDSRVELRELSDEALIARIVEGKSRAAGDVWEERHRPWIVARVRERGRPLGQSDHDVEEAVQQLMLVLWEALPAYHRSQPSGERPGRLRAFAETVVAKRFCNFARDRWRGQRFRRSPELMARLLTQQNAHSGQRALTWDNAQAKRDEAETEALRDRLWAAAESYRQLLSELERKAWDLMLRRRPLKALMAALDRSASTVKRLKTKLQEKFKRYAQLDWHGKGRSQVNRRARRVRNARGPQAAAVAAGNLNRGKMPLLVLEFADGMGVDWDGGPGFTPSFSWSGSWPAGRPGCRWRS